MEGIFNTERTHLNLMFIKLTIVMGMTPNYQLGDDVKYQVMKRYYHSSINNNALFEHPVEIHDRKKNFEWFY